MDMSLLAVTVAIVMASILVILIITLIMQRSCLACYPDRTLAGLRDGLRGDVGRATGPAGEGMFDPGGALQEVTWIGEAKRRQEQARRSIAVSDGEPEPAHFQAPNAPKPAAAGGYGLTGPTPVVKDGGGSGDGGRRFSLGRRHEPAPSAVPSREEGDYGLQEISMRAALAPADASYLSVGKNGEAKAPGGERVETQMPTNTQADSYDAALDMLGVKELPRREGASYDEEAAPRDGGVYDNKPQNEGIYGLGASESESESMSGLAAESSIQEVTGKMADLHRASLFGLEAEDGGAPVCPTCRVQSELVQTFIDGFCPICRDKNVRLSRFTACEHGVCENCASNSSSNSSRAPIKEDASDDGARPLLRRPPDGEGRAPGAPCYSSANAAEPPGGPAYTAPKETEYSEYVSALGAEGSTEPPFGTLPRPALDDDADAADAGAVDDGGGVAVSRLPIHGGDAPPNSSFQPPPTAGDEPDVLHSADTATAADEDVGDRGSVFEPNAFVQDRLSSTLRLKSVRRLNPLFDVASDGDDANDTAQDDLQDGGDPNIFLSQEVVGDAEMVHVTES